MATLIKTVKKTPTNDEWKSLTVRYHKGDVQGALGSAASRSRRSGAAWYVYATHSGYIVDPNEPAFPKGNRFYRITVANGTIKGELFEK